MYNHRGFLICHWWERYWRLNGIMMNDCIWDKCLDVTSVNKGSTFTCNPLKDGTKQTPPEFIKLWAIFDVSSTVVKRPVKTQKMLVNPYSFPYFCSIFTSITLKMYTHNTKEIYVSNPRTVRSLPSTVSSVNIVFWCSINIGSMFWRAYRQSGISQPPLLLSIDTNIPLIFFLWGASIELSKVRARQIRNSVPVLYSYHCWHG